MKPSILVANSMQLHALNLLHIVKWLFVVRSVVDHEYKMTIALVEMCLKCKMSTKTYINICSHFLSPK